MKKEMLCGIIIIIIAGIFCVYLYKKYTIHFCAVSLEELEFESFDFLPSRQKAEHTSTDVLEK